MISIIVLRSGGMKLFIAFLVIGFLEQDIGADTGLFEFAVIFNGRGGNIDVDTADSAVLVLYTVDGLDTL